MAEAENSATGDNPEPRPADVLSALHAELEQAKATARDNWDRFVRAQAEMDNLRKRLERDVENAHKYALERFAGELLPVRDSLELGLAAASGDADVARIREGIELTLKMLGQAMTRFGIAEVNPEGERFDPDRHQAMSMQENTDLPPNTVVAVMQKGYLLHDRLLRPAMVIVSRAPANDAAGVDKPDTNPKMGSSERCVE